MAPVDVLGLYGKFFGYVVALIIGMGFGAVLEMSGFGDSRKLAAQFYLKDMTVLKVMFTAIIVAMSLLFLTSAIGIMDFTKVYVNITFLWPQLLGGLILGIGFIVGGFCPGTSVVAASTFKIDGMFFVGGVFFGVFIFGESFSLVQDFFYSSAYGRFMLPDLFGISAGWILILIMLMAIMMFYGAELSEKFFGRNEKIELKDLIPSNKIKMIGAFSLVFISLITLAIGQPSIADRWERIKAQEVLKIQKREVYIHAGELLEIMNDAMLYKNILDVRSETDYNLFHLENAKRIDVKNMDLKKYAQKLRSQPANTVVVLVSNNEKNSTKAYKMFRALGVVNIYILSKGINGWLDTFGVNKQIAKKIITKPVEDTLSYEFYKSVGESIIQANPGVDTSVKLVFKRKVKIQKKKAITGGCG